MSTQVLERDGFDKEGKVMQTRRTPSLRLLAYATAAALALAVSGDRGLAVGVPASVYGQDPLEVLELKVRPNVFVVLDSSGSMQEMLQYPAQPPTTSNTNHNLNSGDHQRSKMRLAKETLRRVISNNETKVSFLFGQYTQNNSRGLNNDNNAYANPGSHRFQYTSNNDPDMGGFASMTTTELTIQGAQGDSFGRGLQSWQDIRAGWNTLYFDEDAPTDAVCTATLPGPFPRFYRSGADLATDLRNAMNAATCTGSSRANTYNVTYATGTGRFTFSRASGSRSFRIRWDRTPNNIRNALAETSTSATNFSTNAVSTDAPWTLLYRRAATTNSGTGLGSGSAAGQPSAPFKFSETIDPDGPAPLASRVVTYYNMRAGRFFNGETIKVLADGTICDMVYPTAPLPTPLAEFYVQEVSSCGGADVGPRVTFGWSGTRFSGNNISCNGFSAKVPLIPCDLQSPPAPTQVSTINPYIDYEWQLDASGAPLNYTERQDGGWEALTVPANTVPAKADGSTPIAASISNIRTLFTNLWNNGQAGATVMAGPPPYQITPIRTHRNPKEKTIVLFVTDGDDTCASGSDNDDRALAAAYQAELLYRRINGAEPASSVQTYVIGFGNGAAPYRLNWIAWGGSGLGTPTIGNNGTRWTPSYSGSFATNCAPGSKCDSINNSLAPLRANCSTCTDAFIAPDPSTLAAQLQSIIDQGASDGEFSAQQSITESVYEYLNPAVPLGTPARFFDPLDPKTRFGAIYPTRFITSFTLPGFNGQLKAYQNDGAGNTVLLWSAGDKLRHLVTTAMTTCGGSGGALAGQCTFGQIAGTGAQGIKRRVYSTDRNGVYPFTPDSLIDAGSGTTPANRVQLWPPDANVAPADYTSEGILDVELGLPPDTAADPAGEFSSLQTKFQACLGTNRPAGCTSVTPLTRMQTARREARDMVLAFMAGAAPVYTTGGVARSSGTIGTSPSQSLLFVARSWVLGDSELATSAVVTPPQTVAPAGSPYAGEYDLYVKGPRDGASRNPGNAQQIKEGVGLALPDDDADPATPATLEPVMTVVYLPANDMLHAFRAGPNVPASQCQKDTNLADTLFPADVVQMNSTRDCGGEELWGFVPYDQLGAVTLRFLNEPQGRANHVYMLARGIRFGDVFIPGTVTRNLGGAAPPAGTKGLWRRVMYFGRGIGGKYVTALDVTGPGTHLERFSDTIGPIPLWSRGNPDTQDGTPGGVHNNLLNDPVDFDAYAKMGETWSIPTLAYVNSQKGNPLYRTPRSDPSEIDFALFMGSGYGTTPTEGKTHYTLDALTGDVVASIDIPDRGVGAPSYANALVSNSVSFNRVIKGVLGNEHPWSFESSRIYFADLHGRLWKMLTNRPDVVYPAADLGAGQAVATAVALAPSTTDPLTDVGPYVFVTAGAERRAAGPFRNFTFLDTGNEVNPGTLNPVTDPVDGVTTYEPLEKQFSRQFDQGDPEANCGYTEAAVFRGTVQPAGTFECVGSLVNGKCTGSVVWRVFFAGTRLSLPNTVFAPPTPLACGTGEYPCRSQFDSIIYALGAKTGNPAYDLNAVGDDAYRVFRDSRVAAITMQADPDPGRGGSSFTPDEGLIKGVPKPPPPPGVPPTATSATANVVIAREPGKPAPAVRYGSTVCQ